MEQRLYDRGEVLRAIDRVKLESGHVAAHTAKFVLWAIDSFVGMNEMCWPSVAALADRTQLGERSVQYAIRQLQEAGLLMVKPQVKNGEQTTNEYHINYIAVVEMYGKQQGAGAAPGGVQGLHPNHPTRKTIHKSKEKCRQEVGGWSRLEFPDQSDPRKLLEALGVGASLIDQLLPAHPITINQIMVFARQCSVDPAAFNKAYCLAYRLARAHGITLVPPEIGRTQKLGTEWAALAQTRHNKKSAQIRKSY